MVGLEDDVIGWNLMTFLPSKVLFTHNIFAHNIEIKRYCNKKIKIHFLSKYCTYISKSIQINRNEYFQFTQEKNIG